MELKRVVVTGMGAITPIGNSVEEYWDKTNNTTTYTNIPVKTIIREAVHTYAKEPYHNIIINDLDIDIYENDFTVIMGSSGAGKSTLLNILTGIFGKDKISGISLQNLENDIHASSGFIGKHLNIIRDSDVSIIKF